jgi:hypothetical protein
VRELFTESDQDRRMKTPGHGRKWRKCRRVGAYLVKVQGDIRGKKYHGVWWVKTEEN